MANAKNFFNLTYARRFVQVMKDQGLSGALNKVRSFSGGLSGYDEWRREHELSEEDILSQKYAEFSYMPTISILVPCYHTPDKYLEELVQSVLGQTYKNFELILADANIGDGGKIYSDKLDEIGARDERIKVIKLANNGGISENTNEALKAAKGDYIALLDHDDLLTRDALYENVKAINETNAELIYSDEDKIDEVKRRGSKAESKSGESEYIYFRPYFKPDFNLELLRSNNYICHFLVVKRELINKIGGFRKEFDGSQDFDLILRLVDELGRNTEKIHHIGKVLYHWRNHRNSTAANPGSKSYAHEAGRRALEEHLKRNDIKAEAKLLNMPGCYKVEYECNINPYVSVLMFIKDPVGGKWQELLLKTIKSMAGTTKHKDYEFLIMINEGILTGEVDAKTATTDLRRKIDKILEKVDNPPDIQICVVNAGDMKAANAEGLWHAKGQYYVFAGIGMQIEKGDWIKDFLKYSARSDVAFVCGSFRNGKGKQVQARELFGVRDDAWFPDNIEDYGVGYFNRQELVQEISYVPKGILMIREALYSELRSREMWDKVDTVTGKSNLPPERNRNLLQLSGKKLYSPDVKIKI